MLASTSRNMLKVLTPTLADRLRVFNAAARILQAHRHPGAGVSPYNQSPGDQPQSGQRLINLGHTEGYQRHGSAGAALVSTCSSRA